MSVNNNLETGLLLLYPLDGSDASTKFDIIAIHGLGGHLMRSWTAPSAGSNNDDSNPVWIRDFLKRPDYFPQARIFTFGYNCKVSWVGNSVATVVDVAQRLLVQIQNVRQGFPCDRPFLFICHSLGGIILKKALLQAKLRPQQNQHLVRPETRQGVIFMGTPHLGSKMATSLRLIARLSLDKSTKQNILLLSDHSTELQNLCADFAAQAHDLKFVISVYETYEHPIVKKVIVDRHSATMNLGEREFVIPLEADHHFICKFASPQDSNYKMLVDKLRDLITTHFSASASEVVDFYSTARRPTMGANPTTSTSSLQSGNSRGPGSNTNFARQGFPWSNDVAASSNDFAPPQIPTIGRGRNTPSLHSDPSLNSRQSTAPTSIPSLPESPFSGSYFARSYNDPARDRLLDQSQGIDTRPNGTGNSMSRTMAWVQVQSPPWDDAISRQLLEAQTSYESRNYSDAFVLYTSVSGRLKQALEALIDRPISEMDGNEEDRSWKTNLDVSMISRKRFIVLDRLARCCLETYQSGREYILSLPPAETNAQLVYDGILHKQRKNIAKGWGLNRKCRDMLRALSLERDPAQTSMDYCMLRTTELALGIAQVQLDNNVYPGGRLEQERISFFVGELAVVEQALARLEVDPEMVGNVMNDIKMIKSQMLHRVTDA